MNLAIIPARIGSKRIPKKNIKLFCGRPIIEWVIQSVQNSGVFDEVIVSTDSEEVARIALNSGANVPFTRPKELANDTSPTIPVVQHAISQLEQEFEYVACIYPTAAFVTPTLLNDALAQIKDQRADFVMPVMAHSSPFDRALQIGRSGFLKMRQKENLEQRTQDCETLYHDIGQFYLGTYEAWLNPREFYDRHVSPIVLPKYSAVDIDTPEDWEIAELLFKHQGFSRL